MKTGYTHGGTFHADDVFSAVLLKKIFPDLQVKRVFKIPEDLDNETIVFDIGLGKFDHHQADKALRPDGTPYAAFGLLWKEYGRSLCEDDSAFEKFDRDFVKPVDLQDNGVEKSTLSCAISAFNPSWDSDTSADKAFECAVAWAEVAFTAELERVNSSSRAAAVVRQSAVVDGCILNLENYVPWQDVVINEMPDILYVVFPSNRGGFSVQTVPNAPESFVGRKLFPTEWLGHPVTELGMTFCHPGNFILSCNTREQAIAVAKIAAAR